MEVGVHFVMIIFALGFDLGQQAGYLYHQILQLHLITRHLHQRGLNPGRNLLHYADRNFLHYCLPNVEEGNYVENF